MNRLTLGDRPRRHSADAPYEIRTVGQRLRSLRRGRELTQRALADRAGVSLEAVWTIENDRKLPRRSTRELLARALGVSASDLRPDTQAALGLSRPQGAIR